MNKMKRIKGWMEVEAKLDRWIKKFQKSKGTAHFPQSNSGKPIRPIIENIYRSSKSQQNSRLVLKEEEEEDEITAFIKACTSTSDAERHSYPNDNATELTFRSFQNKNDCWSSFEIGKIFPS